MKFTFPNFGNYNIIFEGILKELNVDVVLPPKITQKTIKIGVEKSPELFCFPLKVNVGDFFLAQEKGAEAFLMWENLGGSCRQRYYGEIQKRILKTKNFFILNSKNLFSLLKKISQKSQKDVIGALGMAFFKTILLEKIEKKKRFYLPREKKRGETEKAEKELLEELRNISSFSSLFKFFPKIKKRFSQIKIEKISLPRVMLIGEIYTLVEKGVNLNLEKRFAEQKIEVERKLGLLENFKEGLLPFAEKFMQKRIQKYLSSTVGGHGRQAIDELLEAKKKKFEGAVQILPFGCMPETTVRPILENLAKKFKMAFLSLSFDEETGEAGFQTRVEAFSDLLWKKFERSRK